MRVRCTNANRLDVCAYQYALIVAVRVAQQEVLHACCCMMPARVWALHGGGASALLSCDNAALCAA